MKRLAGALLLAALLFGTPHVCIAEPTPVPVLPDFPTPAPAPKPSPTTPQKLGANELFVIRSEVEFFVLVSPDTGLVKVTEEAGPLRIRAVFVGGDGKTETRTFKEKFLVILEANGVGRVEVIVLPVGGGKYQFVRRTLDVDNGGPAPPDPKPPDPKPPDPKPPDPKPPPNPLTVSLQAAYGADADADKAKSLAFLQLAYATMATKAKEQTQIKTNADAAAWMKSIVQAKDVGLTPTQLVNLRKAIADELRDKWGPTTAALELSIVTAELQRVAKALGEVKP